MERDREAILQKAYDMGFYYEKEYRGCCQSVLAAIQDALGLENDAGFDAVFKSGTAMAAGLCATGTSACGALSGGVMAIGYRFGRERSNFRDPEQIRLKTRAIALELNDMFVKAYGSAICRDVQEKVFGRSFNLLDPEDRQAFEAAGSHVDKCPSIVGSAARMAVEVILDHEGKP